ncbi:MAG: gliding motility protein GldN [Salinivirgaceae bacterium]|jgi:gliding motility associated protien GldN|nr:gliding motility protein GldN [Salinivirgaceae bacterium]
MRRILLFSFVLALAAILLPVQETSAQVMEGIYAKEHVPSRRPVPYAHLREADVMWKKRVWRCIDFRQKMNFHFYFPTERINERMNLTNLLVYGQTHEGVVLYDADEDDRFTSIMTTSEIEERFGAGMKEFKYVDDQGNEIVEERMQDIDYSQVKQVWVKEEWFFDRQRSKLEVRILGLMPIRFYEDENTGELKMGRTFWAYFPAVRPILANHEVFNRFNDAKRKTYDDIFFKRFFDSYIVQESNIYEDREVADYRQGRLALWEAEDIKSRMFNYEQDLWSY